jgi:hypothetical protein
MYYGLLYGWNPTVCTTEVAVEFEIHHKATYCILDIKHAAQSKLKTKEIVEIAAHSTVM